MKHGNKTVRLSQKKRKGIMILLLTLYTAIIILVPLEIHAQSSLMATGDDSPELQVKLDEFLNYYQTFRYESCIAEDVRISGRLILELDGKQREIHLKPNNLRAPDYRRTITLSDGSVVEDFSPAYTYNGYVADSKKSMVRLLVSPHYLSGVVQMNQEMYFVEPQATFLPGTTGNLVVIYKNTDVRKKAAAICGLDRLKNYKQELLKTNVDGINNVNQPWYQVKIATEADEEFSRQYCGFNKCLPTANDIIEGYVNQLDGIWENNLNLRVQLTYQNAYFDMDNDPNTDSDPYNATFVHGPRRSPNDERFNHNYPSCNLQEDGIWEQFSSHWETRRSVADWHVAVLFSGRELWLCDSYGGIGSRRIWGTAGYNTTICTKPEWAYVVMEKYPTNTVGLLAHEIGHSLGYDTHDSDERCGDGAGIGPVLCPEAEAGSNYYSDESKLKIWTHINNYHKNCLTQLPTPSQTVSFAAADDAFVRQLYPNNNYGSSMNLKVRSASGSRGFHTYLKFNVMGISGTVLSAKLKLKTKNNPFPDASVWHMSDNNWSEHTITWNNASLANHGWFSIGPLAANTWQEIEVKSIVTGNGTYTFGLVAPNLPGLTYYSKESTQKPTLIVTYAPNVIPK